MEISAPTPQRPLLIRLFIYIFGLCICWEPLVSGQVGLQRLRQWIVQAVLLLRWPSYAVLVNSSSSHAKRWSFCSIRRFGRRSRCSRNTQRMLGKRSRTFFHVQKFFFCVITITLPYFFHDTTYSIATSSS